MLKKPVQILQSRFEQWEEYLPTPRCWSFFFSSSLKEMWCFWNAKWRQGVINNDGRGPPGTNSSCWANEDQTQHLRWAGWDSQLEVLLLIGAERVTQFHGCEGKYLSRSEWFTLHIPSVGWRAFKHLTMFFFFQPFCFLMYFNRQV